MAIGYFLCVGDKTTCGGKILTGDQTFSWLGVAGARQGDMVSCGNHPGTYVICGGIEDMWDNGRMLAGTLDSFSSCPCQARFIASTFDSYEQKNATRRHSLSDADTPSSPVQNTPSTEVSPQYAQAARKKESREITLTIGVFFDGTGNNAVNTQNMLQACTADYYDLNTPAAESVLEKCASDKMGVTGTSATSYTNYYTNIHWLSVLYTQDPIPGNNIVQSPIYIDGIGTQIGEPDHPIGIGFGIADTGVIAKTDKAIIRLSNILANNIRDISKQVPDSDLLIKSLQFDIFGFSRGAAAARHFANRISDQDPAVLRAIRQGMEGTTFNGFPSGTIRFIGLFDTVAAIGTPLNGLNPHSADTGDVRLNLSPSIARQVFHIAAANECRFNFPLNSVQPVWPELMMPGAHSDIGGGYLPVTREDLFLTRPATETVPLDQPDKQTRVCRQAMAQLPLLQKSAVLAPLLRNSNISLETWSDSRLPADRYGQMQKRSYAALALRNRIISNGWSLVVLRLMLEAAKESGVIFDPIRETTHALRLPDELIPLCEKALEMGRTLRCDRTPQDFSQDDLDIIAGKYIHCSAHWNAIELNSNGLIYGGASPSELIGFINRPDEGWQRTAYNINGHKL